jgi:hypothetical protein
LRSTQFPQQHLDSIHLCAKQCSKSAMQMHVCNIEPIYISCVVRLASLARTGISRSCVRKQHLNFAPPHDSLVLPPGARQRKQAKMFLLFDKEQHVLSLSLLEYNKYRRSCSKPRQTVQCPKHKKKLFSYLEHGQSYTIVGPGHVRVH